MPDPIAVETILMFTVPVVAGIATLRLARTWPWLQAHPVSAAVRLFVLLVIASALLSPGGDLVTPTIGGIVSALVSVAVLVQLLRSREVHPV